MEIITSKKILIVGETWDDWDESRDMPFSGPAGTLLRRGLRLAGIAEEDCTLTMVFPFRPTNGRLESLGSPRADAIPGWPKLGQIYVASRFAPHLKNLQDLIAEVKPNIIIPLGLVAMWAVCKNTGIKKWRGTPLLDFTGDFKVLPTYAPSSINRSYKLFPIFVSDLAKAKKESTFPEIIRPSRLIHIEPSLTDIAAFYEEFIVPAPVLDIDIETKMGTVTEVGFATGWSRAIVIPFYTRAFPSGNYWKTAEEELQAWRWVERILKEKPVINQNISYDLQMLWMKNNIAMPEILDDTMILHHTLYPEMEKSLGFLGSIYTNEPSWKFMRHDAEALRAEEL
jgi:uracil-DNA glycosylase